MRAIHLSDLHHAACAIRGIRPDAQDARMRAAIAAAQLADRFRKATDRPHPTYGPGTLSGVFGPVEEPQRCDQAYLEAMRSVIAALLAR